MLSWVLIIWVLMSCNLVEVNSVLKIEIIKSSDMLLTIYKITWHHNPEEHRLQFHHHENHKSHNKLYGNFTKKHNIHTNIFSKIKK
jgi:hypothetical protein